MAQAQAVGPPRFANRLADAGQRPGLLLPRQTPLHGKANLVKPLIANFCAALQHARAAAKQFEAADRWAALLRYVSDRIAPTLRPFKPPDWLPATE